MRTMLNQKRRLRVKQKRNHDAEIREALDNGEELAECQICYTLLTSKNRVALSCEHNFDCFECMENWFKKSRLSKGISLMPIVGNVVDSVEGRWKFPAYFDDCSTFKCPTCRVEHTFLQQNKENIKPVQPQKSNC